MSIVAVIQARMGSSRLPGKVLADVSGKPLIYHVITRASRIRHLDDIVVAIPDGSEDDPLFAAVSDWGIRIVRGSENDVLARYIQAVDATGADAVVRITADCPLLSPEVSTRVVETFRTRPHHDYVSNTLDRTFPRGLDTEAVSATALSIAASEAKSHTEREHVTPFIWQHPERFKLASVRHSEDLSAHRWTVDTDTDLQFVREIYRLIGRHEFELPDVLNVLDANPEVVEINANVVQKELDA